MNKEQHVREIEARVSHGVLKTISPYITPYVYSDCLPGYNDLTVEVRSTNHSQRTQINFDLTKYRTHKEKNKKREFGCSMYFSECVFCEE